LADISILSQYLPTHVKTQNTFWLPWCGACANKIIPAINRSFIYKAKEGRHVNFIWNSVWHVLIPMYKNNRPLHIPDIFLCASYFSYNVNVHADELSSARIWQHTFCATLSANVNINYRLPIKVYYRICTLRHIRIEMMFEWYGIYFSTVFVLLDISESK
jgi:hypothetical protein